MIIRSSGFHGIASCEQGMLIRPCYLLIVVKSQLFGILVPSYYAAGHIHYLLLSFLYIVKNSFFLFMFLYIYMFGLIL